MNYEVVDLQEKILVGVSATTSNVDPKMNEIISGLWQKLYQGGISEQIKNKAGDYAYGLYSDYNDGQYCVTAGNAVTKAENDGLTVKVIPAGKYAKFPIHGNMVTAVSEAWDTIWKMDLDRSYAVDFEEYLDNNWEDSNINIYIALK